MKQASWLCMLVTTACGAAGVSAGSSSSAADLDGTAAGGSSGSTTGTSSGTAASGGHGTSMTSGTSGGASANCATIAPGGSLVDGAGNVWTIVGGEAVENGGPGEGDEIIELAYVGGEIYQENAVGGWWGFQGGAWAAATDPLTGACAGATGNTSGGTSAGSTTGRHTASTTTTSSGTTTSGSGTGTTTTTTTGGNGGNGAFQVSDGQILDPDGNPFLVKGLNLWDQDMKAGVIEPSSNTNNLQDLYPSASFIRLNCFPNDSDDSPGTLAPYIDTITNNGQGPMVVELEWHYYGTTINESDGTLRQAEAWYQSVAAAFAGNPYVWYGTQNEPGTGDPQVNAEIDGVYSSIRGAGANSPILMTPGGGTSTAALTESTFANLTNVVWDFHFYAWIPGNSTDLGTVQGSLSNEIGQGAGFTSADGVIPAVNGEFGEGADSSSLDQGAPQVLMAVEGAVGNETSGCSLWELRSSDTVVDNTTNDDEGVWDPNADNSLDAYGQGYSSWMQTGTPSGST